MEWQPVGRGRRERRVDLSSLEPSAIRLVTLIAGAVGAAFGVLYIVTGDPAYGYRTLLSASAALVGSMFVVRNKCGAFAFFMFIAGLIVVSAPFAAVEGTDAGAAVALAVVGMAGSLFVRHHLFSLYLSVYAAIILLAHLYWTGTAGLGAGVGAITAAGFLFGSIVFSWLRRQTAFDADRYRNLFTRAPVSIWEEDFTEVASFLDELRSSGVTDLAAHLERNPADVRLAAGKIEVKAVNQAAVDLLEAESTDQLVGRLNPKTLTEDAFRSIIPQLLAVWERRDHAVIDVSGARTMAGNRLDAILSWTVPRIGDRLDLSHVTVAIADVTEMRQTQAELEGLLVAKDEFIASVSHELRTPLTAVVGLAAELSDNLDRYSRSETREFVDLIAGQGDEVVSIVEDLLVAAKANAGTLDVASAPVDVRHELEDVLKGMSVDDHIPVDGPPSLPLAAGDDARVRQIVRNLLVNAQRYGGDSVRIVVAANGDTVGIEVRDSGEPLPDDEREAIFGRYYRARQVPGVTASVGLGLTLSRELARRMGGNLFYAHTGDEAVFRLELPSMAHRPV